LLLFTTSVPVRNRLPSPKSASSENFAVKMRLFNEFNFHFKKLPSFFHYTAHFSRVSFCLTAVTQETGALDTSSHAHSSTYCSASDVCPHCQDHFALVTGVLSIGLVFDMKQDKVSVTGRRLTPPISALWSQMWQLIGAQLTVLQLIMWSSNVRADSHD